MTCKLYRWEPRYASWQRPSLNAAAGSPLSSPPAPQVLVFRHCVLLNLFLILLFGDPSECLLGLVGLQLLKWLLFALPSSFASNMHITHRHTRSQYQMTNILFQTAFQDRRAWASGSKTLLCGTQFFFFFFFLKVFLTSFIFWLHWVFTAVCGLSLVGRAVASLVAEHGL